MDNSLSKIVWLETCAALLRPQDRTRTTSIPLLRSTYMPPTAVHSQDCHIFDLPPEVRNRIYEYVFNINFETTDLVELTEAEPPSKSLILTCRQVFNEAGRMHISAYRSYWTGNEFTIFHAGNETTMLRRRAIYEALERIDECDLAHIQTMTIANWPGFAVFWRYGIWVHCYHLSDGVWIPGALSLRLSAGLIHPLREAGYSTVIQPSFDDLSFIDLSQISRERKEEVKRILFRPGFSMPGLSLRGLMVIVQGTMRIF